MSDTKFTKGEWRVERFVNDRGFEIAFNDDGEVIADYVYYEFDAHLIAAAPEMYDEIEQDIVDLKLLISTLNEQSNDWIFYSSKLKGKSQLLEKARGEL